MFNEQELKNLQIFLNRVDIKGHESLAHAEVMMKIGQMLAMINKPTPPKDPPPKDPPEDDITEE